MKDVPIQMSSFSFVYTLKTSLAWQSVVVTIFYAVSKLDLQASYQFY